MARQQAEAEVEYGHMVSYDLALFIKPLSVPARKTRMLEYAAPRGSCWSF